jgi:hypothetical protein
LCLLSASMKQTQYVNHKKTFTIATFELHNHSLLFFFSPLIKVFRSTMQSSVIRYFLFLAVLALAAKPFIGFSFCGRVQNETETNIFVKAFTKRKQEYVEDSEYDVTAVQQRLSNPVMALLLLFTFFLDKFFNAVLQSAPYLTIGFLTDIRRSQSLPLHRYLLVRKLNI